MTDPTTSERPAFLDYSPADVVSMGVERGLPPERIAQGLMKHRANVEGYGRERYAAEPDKYFKGSVQLDKDIESQLGQVRLSAERAALAEALPEVTSQQRLVSQLEAGGYDPDALDDDLRPALDKVMAVRSNEAFQMPLRSYGGAVKVGETMLARYAMREAGDGMMDVSLAFDDDSTDLVRVPKVTREDVKAEFAKRRQAVEAAAKAAAAVNRGNFLDPLQETLGGIQYTQAQGNVKKAKDALAALIEGRETYLQGERVRDALKDEKFRGRAGQYAGWTEFLKGAADATINSGALVARLAGRDDWMKELSAGQEALDTALPGSTRRQLEGGTWNESVRGAQRALGTMAPMIAGGVATRGLTAAVGAEAELARQAVGRLGVAGAGMSATATGGAYLDTQREIEAAEAAGNTAKADRIRMGRDLHALLTGAVEGAIERIGAAQAFNVGKGAKGLLKDFIGEGVEEPVTGLVQRGVVDPITIDRQQNITDPLATEALTGLLAAGPLVGGGAVVQRATGSGTSAAAPTGGQTATVEGALPGVVPDAGTGAVTPLVGVAQRAGAMERVRLPQEEAESGLADLGAVEGDVTNLLGVVSSSEDDKWVDAIDDAQVASEVSDRVLIVRMPDRSVRVLPTNEPAAAEWQSRFPNAPSFVRQGKEGMVLASQLTEAARLQQEAGQAEERGEGWLTMPAVPMASIQAQVAQNSEFDFPASTDSFQAVEAPDGSKSWGVITPEMEVQSNGRLSAAPIIIKVGFNVVDQQADRKRGEVRDYGFGLRHLLRHGKDIEKATGRSVPDFLAEVLSRPDAVYFTRTGRPMLVRTMGKGNGAVVVELVPKAGAYSVTTAVVYRQNYDFTQSNELLWRRSEPASPLKESDPVGTLDPQQSNDGTGSGFRNTDVIGRRQDGSTILFGELVNLASGAVQAGVAFARWAADMVSRFGAAVRRYLQGAWQAASKTSQQGFFHPGDLPGVIRTRLGLQQNAPFRVNQLAARDLLLGSPLPAELGPLVARSEREAKAVEQTAAQLARDLQAAEQAAVTQRGRNGDILHGYVTGFLNGVPAAGAVLQAMDDVTYQRARRMRNFIDDLSAEVAATLPVGPLRNALVNNMGAWLRRSYAAFDQASGWNFDNLMRAAARGQQVGGRPALDVLRRGAAFLSQQGGYPANQRTGNGLPVAGSPLEADMRALMDREQFERSLTGLPGVSKNVTSLMQRREIPAEIRELMGEETNVVKRFLKSANFQAQFIRRHHAQLAIRRVGLAAGLFSTTRQGVFTQEIPGEGPRWAGLAGLWTTPQLWEALQRSAGVAAAGSDIAAFLGRFLRFTSSKAKLNRVAMNPDSWAVNGLGGSAMMLMNGDWFSGRVGARLMEAVRLMRAGRAKSGAVVNAAADALQEMQRDMIARLTAEGVLGQGLSAADIEASLPRATLQWIEMDAVRNRLSGAAEGAIIGQGIGRGLGLMSRVVGGVVGGAVGAAVGAQRIRSVQERIADLALTKPDMLFRLTGFLTNYETALGAGLAPDAAFNQAAERTLNTFPNYKAVPAFLRSLSQFGLINSFVSFMFEVYRNSAWSMRYMIQDLASGNPAMMRRGLQRLAGVGSVGALMAGGLQSFLAALLGGDDDQMVGAADERNAIFTRWFAAPWERDAVLAFTKFDSEGVSYLNTSYLLPQQVMGELAMAVRNGENPADAAARLVVRLQEQFVGSSVNLTPLLQAYTNADGRGRPVSVRDGAEGALERIDHAMKVIAEPGFVDKIERLHYAYREAERRGRTFSVEQEFRRVIGLREMTRTWEDLAVNRYREFDKQIGQIREAANRELGQNLPGAQKSSMERANQELDTLRQELFRFEREAVKLGLPSGTLMRAKKEVGVNVVRNVMVDPIKGNRVKSIGGR